jgi:hypothetical protein
VQGWPHATDPRRGPAFRSLGCDVYGQPSLGDDSETGDGVGDFKGQFRFAWPRIRAGLTEADIATVYRYAKASHRAAYRFINAFGGLDLTLPDLCRTVLSYQPPIWASGRSPTAGRHRR